MRTSEDEVGAGARDDGAPAPRRSRRRSGNPVGLGPADAVGMSRGRRRLRARISVAERPAGRLPLAEPPAAPVQRGLPTEVAYTPRASSIRPRARSRSTPPSTFLRRRVCEHALEPGAGESVDRLLVRDAVVLRATRRGRSRLERPTDADRSALRRDPRDLVRSARPSPRRRCRSPALAFLPQAAIMPACVRRHRADDRVEETRPASAGDLTGQ
jgi:hypothetical protein